MSGTKKPTGSPATNPNTTNVPATPPAPPPPTTTPPPSSAQPPAAPQAPGSPPPSPPAEASAPPAPPPPSQAELAKSDRKLGREPAKDTSAPELKAAVKRMDQPPPTSSNDAYGVDHLPEGVEPLMTKDKYVLGEALGGKAAVVDHQSLPWIHTAIHCFGHVILGVDVPAEWLKAEELLDIDTDRFSNAGGSVIVVVGYGPYVDGGNPQTVNGPFNGQVEYQVIAWGKPMRLTERAMEIVTREAFVVIDRDFYNRGGFDADGFDWDALSKPRPSPQPEPAAPAGETASPQPPPPTPAVAPAPPTQPPVANPAPPAPAA